MKDKNKKKKKKKKEKEQGEEEGSLCGGIGFVVSFVHPFPWLERRTPK